MSEKLVFSAPADALRYPLAFEPEHPPGLWISRMVKAIRRWYAALFRVLGLTSLPRGEKFRLKSCHSHQSFRSIVGQGSECELAIWDPKGDELL